ncbi:arrestin domain-containing protein 3 [Elysia marginata]|uniref:Arrestin domain-containing protein 3 n=1 Tax=Elysia marginata TaxID=1093978 RepID=A0AAV4H1Y6_9GAST|nr:arrestin domain-containing protein 3 [Elysia marginata]
MGEEDGVFIAVVVVLLLVVVVVVVVLVVVVVVVVVVVAVVVVVKIVSMQGIRMTIRGKAFVHWSEQAMRGPGESRFKGIRHHSATEEYFDFSQQLLSKVPRDGHKRNEKRVLEAGQYTYPFQFRIPATSPSSFEGQYGFIRYWVKVSIERPWKEDNSVKKFFSVICPVDLNREPTASEPTSNEKEKRLCCLCCVSGPITASVRLAQKGYVPGEPVYVYGDVSNLSRRQIGSTSVELLMTTTFHTPTKTRTVTQTVARMHHGSLRSGGSASWDGDRLVLPPLPPSYMIGCSIMTIKYTLELRVFPTGPAFELSIPLEILVGTVPIHATLDRYLNLQQHQTTHHHHHHHQHHQHQNHYNNSPPPHGPQIHGSGGAGNAAETNGFRRANYGE